MAADLTTAIAAAPLPLSLLAPNRSPSGGRQGSPSGTQAPVPSSGGRPDGLTHLHRVRDMKAPTHLEGGGQARTHTLHQDSGASAPATTCHPSGDHVAFLHLSPPTRTAPVVPQVKAPPNHLRGAAGTSTHARGQDTTIVHHQALLQLQTARAAVTRIVVGSTHHVTHLDINAVAGVGAVNTDTTMGVDNTATTGQAPPHPLRSHVPLHSQQSFAERSVEVSM